MGQGLVYGCLLTKAVCLLLTRGYSTDSFLLRHAKFVARHVPPQTVRSDRGSNLVRAGMSRITASNRASNWEFTEVDCQWRKGFIERMVGVMNTALPTVVVLTYGEMVTLLARIAFTINCRPIGIVSRGVSDRTSRRLQFT